MEGTNEGLNKENNVYYFQTEHLQLHQNDDIFLCKRIKNQ